MRKFYSTQRTIVPDSPKIDICEEASTQFSSQPTLHDETERDYSREYSSKEQNSNVLLRARKKAGLILLFVIFAIKAMSALALLCLLTPATAKPRFGLGSTRSRARHSYRRKYVPSRPNRLASHTVAVRMRPREQKAAYSPRGYTRRRIYMTRRY